MKIPGRAVAMAAALAVCATSAAQAATLMVNEGSVLVNRGDGFKSVTGSVEVAAGDTIMVKAGGRGLVTFPDQCNVRVDAGATYTVGARSPCALADAQTGTQPTGAPVGLPPVAGAGLGTTGLLVGGAVVAVGAGVAIAASKSSRPASP